MMQSDCPLLTSESVKLRPWAILMERCAGPLREQRARVDAEIRAVLTPEQQQRFDKLVKEHEERKFGRPLSSAPSGS